MTLSFDTKFKNLRMGGGGVGLYEAVMWVLFSSNGTSENPPRSGSDPDLGKERLKLETF